MSFKHGLLIKHTKVSEYIQLYPGDSHKKWAKILDCDNHGMTIQFTRIKIQTGMGGSTPNPGDIHFYPWNKLHFKYVDKEEATYKSFFGYGDKRNVRFVQQS
jgi:hypothetical protein